MIESREVLADEETVVREALSKIDAGIEGIVSTMTPAQRAMVFKEIDSILSGVTIIENMYDRKAPAGRAELLRTWMESPGTNWQNKRHYYEDGPASMCKKCNMSVGNRIHFQLSQ